jgi:hypothetical protein
VQRMSILLGFLVVFPGCGSSQEPHTDQENPLVARQDVASKVATLSAFEIGAAAARQSIEQDILVLKEYPPLPYPPGHNFYVALLEKECGVKSIVGKPGDTPEDQFIQQVQGWNSVMRPEIQRRFGEDIFERLEVEAQRQFQDSRGAQEVKPTPILGNR